MRDRSTSSKSVALRAHADAKAKAKRDAEARRIVDHPAYAPAFNSEYAKWVAFYAKADAADAARDDHASATFTPSPGRETESSQERISALVDGITATRRRVILNYGRQSK